MGWKTQNQKIMFFETSKKASKEVPVPVVPVPGNTNSHIIFFFISGY
jgi:hypothetical protein